MPLKRSWSTVDDVMEDAWVAPRSADAFRVAVLAVFRDALEDILDDEDTLEEENSDEDQPEPVSSRKPGLQLETNGNSKENEFLDEDSNITKNPVGNPKALQPSLSAFVPGPAASIQSRRLLDRSFVRKPS